ncbi:40S ribosomal protein S15 [Microtus ochrogaster]|uniref:40S ribosomal protein S15 n=1 Tax=Microtus ochrogaster TaxID=79684 RepID=A0A8J6GLU0_MICOH|nr:40S ribosomal protein S15 [Microtus ochrogaster]
MAELEQKKKQTYRGVDLDQLMDMSSEPLMQLYSARQRRRLNRDLPAEAAPAAQAPEKSQEGGAAHGEARDGKDPPVGHDHPARDGGKHSGRVQRRELQPGGDQAGDDWHYLGEFSITHQPVKQGRPGVGATHSHSSSFIPLK